MHGGAVVDPERCGLGCRTGEGIVSGDDGPTAGGLDVMTPDENADVALARLYRGPAAEAIPDAELGAALRHLFDEGRRAWPGLALGVEAFVAHLAHLAESVEPGLPPAARGPDLYLACACATRVRGAVGAFDR